MIHRVLQAYILAACIPPTDFPICRNARASEMPVQPRLRQGIYLSADYLDRLNQTKSPLFAAGKQDINLIIVEILDDAYLLHVKTIINFREGGPVFYLAVDGEARVAMRAGKDLSRLTLRAEAFNRLRFGFGDRNPELYIWEPRGLNLLLREIAIAGRYANAAGEVFAFTPAGIVVTPTGPFPYEVGADHI